MKTSQKQLITLLLLLPLISFLSFSCSSDDDNGNNNDANNEENQVSSCTISGIEVSGIIDDNLLGSWPGEIYFNSVNDSYEITHTFNENGTLSSTGPVIPTLNGCWRVNGQDLEYVGTLDVNGNTVTAQIVARIITQDSIYGTHTATNGENGSIWMVR